jgi:hypothetical protein
MNHSTLPKSPRVLLPDLEAIKQVMNKKHQANLKIKVMEASTASASTGGNPKKCSVLGGPGEQVPKKGWPTKFCQHCRNEGGPHLTHNAKECCKYGIDSNPVAAAVGKPFEGRKLFKKGGHMQLAYLPATVVSLVKKGLKKAVKSKKHKCRSVLSSSDFDGE